MSPKKLFLKSIPKKDKSVLRGVDASFKLPNAILKISGMNNIRPKVSTRLAKKEKAKIKKIL